MSVPKMNPAKVFMKAFSGKAQFSVLATVFDRVKLCQGEKVMARATRYSINAIYAAVNTHTTVVNTAPFTSEEKKSSKR